MSEPRTVGEILQTLNALSFYKNDWNGELAAAADPESFSLGRRSCAYPCPTT
jgi:hypothetical protein